MKNILLAILIFMSAPAAFGTEGSVCLTKEEVGMAEKPVDATTKFFCQDVAEGKTISELYKAGWTVAQMIPQAYFKGTTTYVMWMLIIERK